MKSLIDSYISHDAFASVNKVLKEYDEMKEETNFCAIYYMNMVDISIKAHERNGIEARVDNGGILWLNENR